MQVQHNGETSASRRGEVRVQIRGEVDLCVAPEIQADTDAAFATPGVERVVIDLAECTFIDSSGLHVLVAAAQTAQARGQTLRITGSHGVVQRVIELTGLDSVLPLASPS